MTKVLPIVLVVIATVLFIVALTLVAVGLVDSHKEDGPCYDKYGNLSSEMIVPWGKKSVYMTNFDHRTLFARRGYSPLWLELLAYTIVVAVWSIIFYLLVQIKNIKKLGVE